VVLHVLGLSRTLLELLDGELEHLLRLAGLGVAQRAQVDAAQQAVGFQVVGIARQDLLGLQHRVADASGLGVELGQLGVEVFRGGIGGQRGAVFVDGLAHELGRP
jgi:hypothetical protein